MSERDSRMEMALSALTASTGQKPASSTISTARMRSTISSSTTRTFGTADEYVGMGGLILSRCEPFDGQPGERLYSALLRLSRTNSELNRRDRLRWNFSWSRGL